MIILDPFPRQSRSGNRASFEDTSQLWLTVGNTVSDLTAPQFEPQISAPETNALTLDQLGDWSSSKTFVSVARGLRFESRAVQIGHSVANGSPQLRYYFEKSCVART